MVIFSLNKGTGNIPVLQLLLNEILNLTLIFSLCVFVGMSPAVFGDHEYGFDFLPLRADWRKQ